MAYDASLAHRIREALGGTRNVIEKQMFGGIVFMLHGNMLVGVWKDSLIVRLGPTHGEAALEEPNVRVFDVTGRPMKNWVMVEPEGLEEDEDLRKWIERAKDFVETLPAK